MRMALGPFDVGENKDKKKDTWFSQRSWVFLGRKRCLRVTKWRVWNEGSAIGDIGEKARVRKLHFQILQAELPPRSRGCFVILFVARFGVALEPLEMSLSKASLSLCVPYRPIRDTCGSQLRGANIF